MDIHVVLNDGSTYSSLEGAFVAVPSKAALEVLDETNDYKGIDIVDDVTTFNLSAPADLRALADYLESR